MNIRNNKNNKKGKKKLWQTNEKLTWIMLFEMENNKVGSKKDNDNSNSEFLRDILNKCRMIMK